MKLFNKKQLEIINLASPDETRVALNGLYFDGNKTVVTDGHRLVYVENTKQCIKEDWPANGIKWDGLETPFLVSKNTIQKALKNIPKKTDFPILKNVAIGLKERVENEPENVICQTTDLENTDNIEARTIGAKFPNYKQIIPDFENSSLFQRVGLNATYLKEVCAVMEKYNSGPRTITLYVKKDEIRDGKITLPGEHCPIVVTANDEEGTKATAIIMPVRL